MPRHHCPRRGCKALLPYHLFACKRDWFALSVPVREAIRATSGLHVMEKDRRDAIEAAREEWKMLDE